MTTQMIDDPARKTCAMLGFEVIDEIDDDVKATPRATADKTTRKLDSQEC
jgi:hypothetical protein